MVRLLQRFVERVWLAANQNWGRAIEGCLRADALLAYPVLHTIQADTRTLISVSATAR